VKNFTTMVRSAFAFGLTACTLVTYAPAAYGRGVTGYGTVTGRVLDTDSLQPIAGATITIGNIISITAAIDRGGFVLRNVPAGKQTVTITAVGFKNYRTQITVVPNAATDVGTIGLPSSLNR
jgi:hypothetical protein